MVCVAVAARDGLGRDCPSTVYRPGGLGDVFSAISTDMAHPPPLKGWVRWPR